MTFVNCWHMSEHESAAMWQIYGENNTAIAIQSRVGRLKSSMESYSDYPVLIGQVGYLDFSSELVPERKGLIYPCFYKRKSFQYESELRAVICTVGGNPRDETKPQTEWDRDSGLYAPVDAAILVENVFIAPKAPQWFVELLEAIVERLGYALQIVQSDLASGPLY